MRAQTVSPGAHERPVSQPARRPVPDAFASVLVDVDLVVAEDGDLSDLGGVSGSLGIGQ